MFFWYTVKTKKWLVNVQCTLLTWHFLQITKKTRPCLTGHPVYLGFPEPVVGLEIDDGVEVVVHLPGRGLHLHGTQVNQQLLQPWLKKPGASEPGTRLAVSRRRFLEDFLDRLLSQDTPGFFPILSYRCSQYFFSDTGSINGKIHETSAFEI